jgi:hypothetical protein
LGVSGALLGAALFNPIASPESPGFMASPFGGGSPAVVKEKAAPKDGAVKKSAKAAVSPSVIGAPRKDTGISKKKVAKSAYDFDGATAAPAKKATPDTSAADKAAVRVAFVSLCVAFSASLMG